MTTVFNRLGPYEIVQPIGSGGMAQVFLATDTRTGSRVALRLVPLGYDHEAREILEAERLGAQLQEQFSAICPLVPQVYEHGELPDYFYVAMECLDGENLSDVIARGRIDASRAVTIAIELCRFLEVAHAFETTIDGRPLRSLLHGDLKPRNVRVTATGTVKVLDFGMAKALSLSRKVTRTDFGTLGYMSPERLETGEMDAYSDFWSLGVMLYQMLGGVPPFAAPDTRRLERLITSRRPPPSLDGVCPPALQAVVGKLLAPSPDVRYASATEIVTDLARYQSGVETEAQREGWPARADEPPTQRTHSVTEEDATRRTRPEPSDRERDETRRTSVAAPQPVVPVGAPPAQLLRAPRRRLRGALIGVALLLVANESCVSTAAQRTAGIAISRELDGLDELWARYDRLSERSYLRFGVAGLEHTLRDRTRELTDRVIANYRMPAPTVREAQWQAARDALQRALATAPSSSRLKASLRYCEGHLHRIDGEARKSRRELSAARQELTEAVAAFREAAALRPDWPDPFLGLMRTFIYGLEDIDRAADALTQAQRLGFTPGDRETAQLADGYRRRGETIRRTARDLAGMPQEAESLERAADSLRQALTLYSRIPAYGGVATNLRRTQRALDQIVARIELLEGDVPEEDDGWR
jgi:serine/threonine protein kinase